MKRKNNIKYCLIILILFMFISTISWAQPNNLRIQQLQQEVIDPGTVWADVQEVVVDPDDSGGATVNVSGNPSHRAAGTEYIVYFGQEEVELENDNGDTIIVTDFSTNLTDDQGVLDADGEDSFRIGATFKNITSDISGGEYVGEANIIIETIE